MLIREAMRVFWQTLKDTWEELYSIGMVNLVWLFSWGLPVGLSTATKIPIVIIAGLVLGILLFPVTMAGIYYVANRVAHATTFHFSDFVEGIKRYWWRALLWLLANGAFVLLIYMNLQFYPSVFEGQWVALVLGFWIAVFLFWVMMQIYFWPLLIAQEEPKMLLAWRNSAYLILANPFYAFFIFSFTLVLLAVSIVLTLPFIFVGMGILAILGNNAVLTLLSEFDIIENPRPKPLH
ncbi:MAG: hypothetical protein U9R48_06195 [Chloroflexota bacterium]|nr:hypothetical protein [Chloroflexota bacterium]